MNAAQYLKIAIDAEIKRQDECDARLVTSGKRLTTHEMNQMMCDYAVDDFVSIVKERMCKNPRKIDRYAEIDVHHACFSPDEARDYNANYAANIAELRDMVVAKGFECTHNDLTHSYNMRDEECGVSKLEVVRVRSQLETSTLYITLPDDV